MKTIKKMILTNLADIALISLVWVIPLMGFVAWLIWGVNLFSALCALASFIHVAFAGARGYYLLEKISGHFERTLNG